MKKIITIVVCTILIMSAFLVTGISANQSEPSVSIDRHTLTLKDNIWIVYFLKSQNIPANAETGVLIWDKPQESYTIDSKTICGELVYAGKQTISGIKYDRYEYKNVSARNMATDYYAVAYVKDGNEITYSAVDKYSVLQYIVNQEQKYAGNSSYSDLLELLRNMKNYGASAQKYYDYGLDRLVNDKYYQVEVVGGLLSDGTGSGLYTSGTTLTITAPEVNTIGENFLYWQNSTGTKLSKEATNVVTLPARNETYTAVYGATEDLTGALLFVKLSDGTYSVKVNPDAEIPSEIVVPNKYNGIEVTVVAENAFLDCAEVESITLPSSIKTIEYKAFSGCTGLTGLFIPSSVNTIGTRAFYNCTSLTELTIPASVTSIGTQIFYGCDNLNTVYYNSTYSDSSNPFLNVNSLETIVFGGSYVPDDIARNCGHLKTVTILDNVKYINDGAFYNCTGLTNVTIGNGVTRIGNDRPFGSGTFRNCTSLTSITIPDSVTSIGQYAFNGCTSLTSITIPDSVTRIYGYAFEDCTSLTKVYITDIEAWCDIDFYNSIANPMCNGATLYLNNRPVTTLEIPNTVNSLSYTFSGCTSLTSVTIPGSVSSIGSSAFEGCTSLTSVTIPDSVSSIGSSAFYGCTSLTSITIPDSVSSIGWSAFYGCTSLTSLTIPDSITSMGDSTFECCTNLTTVTIPDSLKSISAWAFRYCENISIVYYTGTAEDWGKISIGSSNSYLTNATRYYYSETEPSEFGAYWRYIDGVPTVWNMLQYTSNGNGSCCISDAYVGGSFVIPSISPAGDTVTEISAYAFDGCVNLESIVIPNSVTTIKNYAFKNCKNLEKAIIPKGVTSIGEGAFNGCSKLSEIYYMGTAEDWGRIYTSSYGNSYLTGATRYYYSETTPATTGNFWRYVNGVPTKW